jgi:hypothetical protein
MTAMRHHMTRLRSRLSVPAGARLARLADVPLDEAANLHATHVAHEHSLNPWRFRVANTPNMEASPVVMLDGRMVGLILWELEAEKVLVRSRVVLPEYQRGWVNTLLLSAGLDGACEGGARRVQFSYADTNRDTEKLATRFKADLVSVVARYSRQLMP